MRKAGLTGQRTRRLLSKRRLSEKHRGDRREIGEIQSERTLRSNEIKARRAGFSALESSTVARRSRTVKDAMT